jgi:hypothetical protein
LPDLKWQEVLNLTAFPKTGQATGLPDSTTEGPVTREEIIDRFIKLLDLHFDGVRGAFVQEPNRGDFFALFKEAYHEGFQGRGEHGTLRADDLAEIIAARPAVRDKTENEDNAKLMYQIFMAWDEWRYAWDRHE